MANKQLKIKRARQNIKLLEEADHDAINKVEEPRFKKILSEQEKQLHHYLAQYLDPNYLPAGITKEYEFPKFFYYTVNSKKNGVVQKRTRTDSAMFKRFMKNKTKREEAKAQGIFKITNEPIKVKIDMEAAYPKKKKSISEDYKSILGNINFDNFEYKEPVKKKYTTKSIHELLNSPYFEELMESEPSHNDDSWLLDLLEDIAAYEEPKPIKINKIESALERRKQEERKIDMRNAFTILGLTPKATISDVKKAYKKLALLYHPDKPHGDAKKFIIIDNAYKDLVDMLSKRPQINMEELRNRAPVPLSEEIANRKNEVKQLKKDLAKTTDERMRRVITAEIERLTQSIKQLSSMARDMRAKPATKKGPTPKKAKPAPAPEPESESEEEPEPEPAKEISGLDAFNHYSNILSPDVPKNVKLTPNIKDLIRRKEIIDSELNKLKIERDLKKIKSIVLNLSSAIGSYNMLYLITKPEWDPNALKPEF